MQLKESFFSPVFPKNVEAHMCGFGHMCNACMILELGPSLHLGFSVYKMES